MTFLVFPNQLIKLPKHTHKFLNMIFRNFFHVEHIPMNDFSPIII